MSSNEAAKLILEKENQDLRDENEALQPYGATAGAIAGGIGFTGIAVATLTAQCNSAKSVLNQ